MGEGRILCHIYSPNLQSKYCHLFRLLWLDVDLVPFHIFLSNSLPVLHNAPFCACQLWGEGSYFVLHLESKLTIQILSYFQIAFPRCWASAFPYFQCLFHFLYCAIPFFCACQIWGEGCYFVWHLEPKLTIQILPYFQIALLRCWTSAFPYFHNLIHFLYCAIPPFVFVKYGGGALDDTLNWFQKVPIRGATHSTYFYFLMPFPNSMFT